MPEGDRVVLVARVPEGLHLDILYITDHGFVVLVGERKLRLLQEAEVPLVELFASSGEYVAAVAEKSREEALAALGGIEEQALAGLSEDERSRFIA
ncbi:MAG TPA: hypothetical protein VKK31_21815 [Thermoanaerobaculia bacterium]|nr:hypothetical protein [Thermoanaerobaculia bacterium]